ncbi:MlaC/ttg2D family ABC transporter substrate-binding protein [Hydrogenovibrio kuenenii]|uniref:MlaC/ttg2D family ABC transporter substrate-binding protein n=1 Tax=Hydrogenovibrio kuenenii TaxID=63658 RepID=UPI0004B197C9|nr:ABC transporter substrate-binding protein [Hydrogenovibrio kuenenii]
MIFKNKVIFLFGLFLLVAMGEAQAQINQTDPKEMVKELSQSVLKQIDLQRKELASDPAKVKMFADEYILPYVDTPKMARYVMGQYWRSATPKQQNDFSEAFKNTLLRSYSQSLIKLKVSKIKVTRVEEPREGRATVVTDVTQSDGNISSVIYRAYLNKHTHKWMLYDVTIEGISLLLNYRKIFASEFDTKGIDQVIASLKEKNKV